MDPKLATPMLVAALVAWMLWRRVRRNIGRQALRPTRMKLRIGVLAVFGALALLVHAGSASLDGALLAGMAAGAALAVFGLRHTRFEHTTEGTFYTPHAWIGALVSVLLLARLAYRFMIVLPAMHAARQLDANPFAAYHKSPLTLALFGLVVGYYVAYYAGVLQHANRTSEAPPNARA